jgi:hypothetical protein
VVVDVVPGQGETISRWSKLEILAWNFRENGVGTGVRNFSPSPEDTVTGTFESSSKGEWWMIEVENS